MTKEESFAEWLKRIQSVGYKDEKKEELRFTYEGGEEEDFPIEKDDFGRYVEVTNKKKTIPTEEFPEGYHFLTVRYLLIEDVPEGKDLNFKDKKYIFLTEINFEGGEFDQEVIFKNSIFTRNISFCNVTFKENVFFSYERFSDTTLFLGEAEFRGTTFLKRANFSNIKFSGKANFESTTFSGESHFQNTTFSGESHFQKTTFSRDVYFGKTTFSRDVYFGKTTFSRDVYFGKTTFSRDVYFGKTTFSRDVYFGKTTFSGETYFGYATFSGETYFGYATFSRGADFGHATFSREAYFGHATFSGGAGFGYVTFSEGTYFGQTTFSGETLFIFSEFHRQAIFFEARFIGETDFQSAKVDFLNFSSVKWGEEGSKNTPTLNLKYAQIATIDYTDTKFPNAVSRHTYLILKNLAIKNNDAIRALEFYRQEMAQHYRELKWRTNPIDKSILGIEWVVSTYGTNPVKAFLWLLGVNTIFIAINFCLYQDFSAELVMSFFTFRYDCLNWTHLAALILNPFLIYEVIKSLRKFSRKL